MPINNEKRGDSMDEEESMPPGSQETPPSSDLYANIFGWVWELLEETETTLSSTILKRYVDSAYATLRSNWAALPAYSALPTGDYLSMDEALGHFVAARYRRKHPKKRTAGELAKVKLGQREFEFTGGSAALTPLEEEWLEQAYLKLQEVSVIAAILLQIRSVPLFQTAGKRKEQRERGIYTRSLNPLFTILADEWDAERHEPNWPFVSLYGY